MACSVWGGSCSLCPWCGEEHCPHFHDHDNDKRYWVYATDHTQGAHDLQTNVDTIEEAIASVKKLAKKHWSYKFEWDGYVELTITDGEYSWYTAVNLLIDTRDGSIYYYNIWKNSYVDLPNKPKNIAIVKPWDGKLDFIYMKELPWYPTPEEWEARRKK